MCRADVKEVRGAADNKGMGVRSTIGNRSAAIASAAGGFCYDDSLRCTWAGGDLVRRLGGGEVVGRCLGELLGDGTGQLEEHLRAALAGDCVCFHLRSGVDLGCEAITMPWPGGGGGILVLRDLAVKDGRAAAEGDFRELVESAGDMLARHGPDGRYVYVSPSSFEVMGYRPEEMLGHYPNEFLPAEHFEELRAAWGISAGDGVAVQIEHPIRRPDGTERWVSTVMRARPGRDGGTVTVGAVRDITEQHEQQARLIEATQRFERAFDQTHVGMGLVDIEGRWTRVNHALCAIAGSDEAGLVGRLITDVTHPDDLPRTVELFEQVVSGARPSYELEKRYLRPDGEAVWVHATLSAVVDERGEVQHLVVQIKDLSEGKELHERLSRLVERDALTGLHSRRGLETALERQVGLARRYDDTAALVMLDLDHFKYLNDTLGYTVGDQIISHVAELLVGRVRTSDVVARLGGDEYAIILPTISPARARDVAANLARLIELRPFTHDGGLYTLSASVGVVIIDRDTVSAQDALANADLALYDAKQQGRNRVAVYSPDIRRDVLDGLSCSQRLKQALAQDGFELHAQPIVELASGRTVMHELLIRMRNPEGQLIGPPAFLPAAVQFGYMPAIDRWVIRRAAQLAAAVPGRRLAVNLAARTLAQSRLAAYIEAEIRAAGANPADLVFEISESDAIANLEEAKTFCAQLRRLGALIALDDFGSGFCGFAYLKALEIDLLKIDGQFVSELSHQRVDRLIVQAIVRVAGGLELPTVAEYVTDEAVARAVRGLGVTYGQGFHLGKPQPLGG